MKALIGYTGFVGGNILEQAGSDFFDEFYNSSNINEIKGKSFDIIVSAGNSSLKWLANKEPKKDLESINNLIECLRHVKCKKFVLISTVDAYPTPINVDEERDIDESKQMAYGRNRYILEKFIQKNFDCLIIRFPNLFGKGLKKNIIYDFLNNNQVEKINSEGVFQFYNLDNIWKDICIAIDNNIKLLNMATDPLSVKDIAKYAFGIDFDNYPEGNRIYCDFHTKYSGIWGKKGKYLYPREEVLNDIKKFVEEYKNKKLKLAISTMGWNTNEEKDVRRMLIENNVKSIEITPDRIFNDKFEFDDRKIKKYLEVWRSYGFEFVSMQGILYKRNDLNIFESLEKRKEMSEYIKKIVSICQKMGVRRIMFGAPKNRRRNTLSLEEADNIAVPFFLDIARYAFKRNVLFCIEPNPKEYGSDYILTAKDALGLVKKINHPGCGINLDTGALIMNNDLPDVILECANFIKHCHISQPMLESCQHIDEEVHKSFADALKKIQYSGWVSIEMKKSPENNTENIRKSVLKVKDVYRIG